MKKITFGGDTYQLELDYDGVEFLEDEFDMSLSKILTTVDIDRQKHIRTIYRALLINKINNISDEKMKEMIKKAVQEGGNDYMTLAKTSVEAIVESQYMKKAVSEGKKLEQKNNLKRMNA
jgi:aspartate/glutamate racemase